MASDLASDSRALWTRRLRNSGNSTVLTIPPAALLLAGVEESDEIQIAIPEEGTILLRKAPADD